MKIRTKISMFVAVGAIIMAISLTGISFLSFRETSLVNEREHGELASELVRNELLISFMQGKYDHEELDAHVKTHIPDLHEIRIIRAKAVEKQMGKGVHSANDIEKKVLLRGSTMDQLIETFDGVKYQYTTPYFAEEACLQCHDVAVGTMLGVVNIELDLTEQRADAMASAYLLIGFLIAFSIVLGVALRRLIMPIVDTTVSMQSVVGMAENGNFSGRLDESRDDELGQISKQTNQLMETLENSFGTIVRQVESMEMHRNEGNNKNLLVRTIESVTNMVEATRFKQTIEDDRNLEDVYKRISVVLENQFSLKRFSMYEANHDKHQLNLIFSKGIPEKANLWCREEIKADNNACRACRTAQDIDSTVEKNICPSFAGNVVQTKENLEHFCIPFIMGGKIGGVLQVLYSSDEAEEVEVNIPTIKTYLSEASPVIESKRLNKVLHESTLKDPMTGLFNRRFLEEFEPGLTASVSRSKSPVAVLMCDIDFFKDTNDTHGHQVGDSVLITAAQIMGKSVRANDYVIRFGGEEFIILLMDASDEKIAEIAERVRSDLESHEFKAVSGSFNKTISIGVDVYTAEGDTLSECIHNADLALYEAKEGGRNQVVRYSKKAEKS
ncbi:MAG: diguanylate cyclase [Mariprofundaceae bacterium]